jgi:hypothetical protein
MGPANFLRALAPGSDSNSKAEPAPVEKEAATTTMGHEQSPPASTVK